MEEQRTPIGTTVSVNLPVFSDAPLQYATNFAVQRAEHEYIVSFFTVNPPLVLGTPDEQREVLQKLGPVPVTCVGRFVIAIGRMGDFVRVMRTVYETSESIQPSEDH